MEDGTMEVYEQPPKRAMANLENSGQEAQKLSYNLQKR